jgi:5-methylcytosine-specific restriction enzyme B
MSYADDVRCHCGKKYVEPARARGNRLIEIRAGDVHRDMGFKNRLPLVCSAIGATVFEETQRIRRVAIEGPLNGANTLFRFEILP